MFYVGQKVVCVDDEFVSQHISKGSVYTIYAIDPDMGHVQLAEVEPHVDAQGYHWYFYAPRFRPVAERKTDISVFTAFLNPANHKEPA